MANKLPSGVLLLGILLSYSGAFALDNFKEFKRDTWDLQVGTNYFSSEANYDSSGKKQNLVSGAKYTLWDISLEGHYTPRRNWSMFAIGNIGNSESDNTVAKRTNSTFNEITAGMEFLAYSEAFQFVPEFGIVIPMEEVNMNSDSSLNSEGVFQAWGRGVLQKDFGTFRGYGWLGFQYRGDGRSYLMPWGVGGQLKISKVRLGAELYGSQSISDDTDKGTTKETQRVAYLQQVDAGSFRFYSINPSTIDTMAYATIMFNPKWSMQFNGGATVGGNNSAQGFHLGGFIRYTFDMTEGYVEKPYVPTESQVPPQRSNMYHESTTTTTSEMSSEKKVKQFREDVDDGVSQDEFKARPTQAPRKKKVKPADSGDFPMQLKKQRRR